jgi:diguanylate cyclase (GGDEF)-like protein
MIPHVTAGATDPNAVRIGNRVLAGTALTIATTWAGLEFGGAGAEAYLLGVPALAAVPVWLTGRQHRRGTRALRRALDREHMLTELGTALLTATRAADVYGLAARAADALLDGCPGVRASLLGIDPDEPDTFLVAGAAGHDAGEVAGRRVPFAALPAGLLERLGRGEVVTGSSLSGLGITGFDFADGRPMLLLPLINGARFAGLLGVSSAGDLPADVVKALHTLRTQASLALDSVALTAELSRRASFDALTGLGNRALLRDRLVAALARARRSGRPVAALMLDLNGFKQVNDAHGHDVGDRVLREVADRLKLSVRAEDVVGRLGGDEFVVLAEDLHAAKDATVIADRIVAALDEPIVVGRGPLRATASIGIALSRSDTEGPDELLRLADAAMYLAKRRGGGYHLDGAVVAAPPGPYGKAPKLSV